jgi:hypothetical protein
MRVRFLPPMLFVGIYGCRSEQLTTGHSSHFLPGRGRLGGTFPAAPPVRRGRPPGERPGQPSPGSHAPGTSPAVGQRRGHLIWDEVIGGSSPSSWTRRPQDAQLPAERAPRTCPVTEIRTASGAGHPTPVAQPERAPAYEAGGCRFKSCRACCVRSGSGRCAGTWPRRKRVRAPPDTLRYAMLTASTTYLRGSGPTGRGAWLRTRRFRVRIPGAARTDRHRDSPTC